MYRRRSPGALRPVDDVVDAHRIVRAPPVHADELPEWILFEGRVGARPLAEKGSGQRVLGRTRARCLAGESRIELVLDHEFPRPAIGGLPFAWGSDEATANRQLIRAAD